MKPMADSLDLLNRQIVACGQCPRLRAWCEDVARTKRRAYKECEYWGNPVTGFGDPMARLLVIGLAPGAHGANRTGRVFTGDSSGDWLFRAMHQTGFANQPASVSRADGLELNGAWVTASVRCAPPDNKPSREEVLACRPYLEREIALLTKMKVVVALGRLAFDNYLALLRGQGHAVQRCEFAHDALCKLGPGMPVLISSYHPSRQNTQTGRLTEPMLWAVFERARKLL
jgi:uracil-DNA glycosylase family 4